MPRTFFLHKASSLESAAARVFFFFPFHLLYESRLFHHLFSLFLVQHLSIFPCLFVSLLGCARNLVYVHWSGCYSLTVAFHFVSFLFHFMAYILFWEFIIFQVLDFTVVKTPPFFVEMRQHFLTWREDWSSAKTNAPSIFHRDPRSSLVLTLWQLLTQQLRRRVAIKELKEDIFNTAGEVNTSNQHKQSRDCIRPFAGHSQYLQQHWDENLGQ